LHPAPDAFRIAETPRPIALDKLERYLDDGQGTNPSLVTARQQERLAQIAGQRSKAALLPTVSAIAQKSESAGVTTNYFGFSLNFPLQGQSIIQVISAGAQVERASELRRDNEQKLKVDIERLRELVDSGQQELSIRKEAILAAELAVQANLKSQQGGIRTSVDVLNAIQSVADVRNEYTSTAATLAENYLSLLLQSAVTPADALEKVQLAVFEN
jgi:protease secretion system outer membrane protein